MFRIIENERERHTSTQKKKFENLASTKKSRPGLDTKRTVVNISERNLSEDEISVLAKGGNFVIAPKQIPTETSSQTWNQLYDFYKAQEIRIESARIIKKAKPSQSNMKPKELQALRDINKDTCITVLPADKSNATAVMDTEDYKNKIKELLDPDTYHTQGKDPTKTILKKTRTMVKNSSLDEDTKEEVCRSEALTTRLYGLPKIHKPSVPFRPIVSAIGSPTYD
nr:unnamed protein product [Callosobruchus analis]